MLYTTLLRPSTSKTSPNQILRKSLVICTMIIKYRSQDCVCKIAPSRAIFGKDNHENVVCKYPFKAPLNFCFSFLFNRHEPKEYCSAAFLDISHGVDRVWRSRKLGNWSVSFPLLTNLSLDHIFWNTISCSSKALPLSPAFSILADLPLHPNTYTFSYADNMVLPLLLQ